jgi:hypothetical protein
MDDCEKYLTELSGRIAELASEIHNSYSWVKYEDLVMEVESGVTRYKDCGILKNVYEYLHEEYKNIRENGINNSENALLDISNYIIQRII